MGVAAIVFIGYGYYLKSGVQANIQVPKPAVLPSSQIPDTQTHQKMKKLEKSLVSLAQMKEDTTAVSMKVFGWEPVIPSGPVFTNDIMDMNDPDIVTFPYKLTLCFASEKNSFCVIDDVLYANGSMLPDDGKIITIEHDRVQIKKNKITKWIQLSKSSAVSDNTSDKEKTVVSKEKS